MATNAFGLTNFAFGGTASFNWQHLTPIYSGGLINQYFAGAFGAHAVLAPSDMLKGGILSHELHHIWQSRSMGDSYLSNYFGLALLPLLMGRSLRAGLNNRDLLTGKRYNRFQTGDVPLGPYYEKPTDENLRKISDEKYGNEPYKNGVRKLDVSTKPDPDA